uniref:Uncharacterized protein n=1 Tax=Rhizophora mucronata TaxID=61149 RepID=A0A2P2NKD8_RHIMU
MPFLPLINPQLVTTWQQAPMRLLRIQFLTIAPQLQSLNINLLLAVTRKEGP